MSGEQGALFGDLDGLFRTVELLPVTPVAEVRLLGGNPQRSGGAAGPIAPTIAGSGGAHPLHDDDTTCPCEPCAAYWDRDETPAPAGALF